MSRGAIISSRCAGGGGGGGGNGNDGAVGFFGFTAMAGNFTGTGAFADFGAFVFVAGFFAVFFTAFAFATGAR